MCEAGAAKSVSVISLGLQPESHSKDERISHLGLEQFVFSRHRSDRATLEKWESGGRDLEAFMEDLSGESRKPLAGSTTTDRDRKPSFLRTCPYIVAHFKEHWSAANSTVVNTRTLLDSKIHPCKQSHEMKGKKMAAFLIKTINTFPAHYPGRGLSWD